MRDSALGFRKVQNTPRPEAGLRPLDLRLLPAALAAWIAASAATHLPWAAAARLGWTAVIAAPALGLLLLLMRRRSTGAHTRLIGWCRHLLLHSVLCCLVAATVALSAAMPQRAAEEAGWTEAVTTELPFEVVVRVNGDAQLLDRPGFDGEDRLLAQVSVESAQLPGSDAADGDGGADSADGLDGTDGAVALGAAAVLIVSVGEVSADSGSTELVAGQRYRGTVRASPAESGDRATALLFPFGQDGLTALSPDRWTQFTAGFNSLRAATVEHAQHAVADGPALLPAIVLGDRSQQSAELRDAMLDSGLSHLSAVSGTHLALVTGALLGMLRLVRAPRWLTLPVLLLGTVLFVLLVQPKPSVIRAAVMGNIGALAVFAGRGRASFALLCLCVLILLVYDPYYSVEPAFQLSVAATLGIILAGQRIKEMLDPWLPAMLSAPLALTASAQLFAVPVLLPLAEGVQTYSVPANILAGPLLPLVTVPGTAAALLSTAAPWLSVALLWCSGWAAAGIGQIGRAAADMPRAVAPWPQGGFGLALVGLYLLAVLILVVLLVRRGAWQITWLHGLVLGAASGSLVALMLPATVWAGGGLPEQWRVALCDVGQGDMLVVRTAEDAAVIIDAGDEPEAADDCLDDLGISAVEMLMITHDHRDHYAGAPGVVRGREVGRVLYSATSGWDAAAAMGIGEEVPTVRAELGQEGRLGETFPVSYRIWSAYGHFPNPNDNSLVVQLSLYETAEAPAGSANVPLRLLVTGDLEEELTAALLRQDRLPQEVDLLKVAHHGAANGGLDLLKSREPAVALIGVGEENSYGHPDQSILDALAEVGAVTYRTDLHGTVILSWEEGLLSAVRLPN